MTRNGYRIRSIYSSWVVVWQGWLLRPFAADNGARVLVVEKDTSPGGSGCTVGWNVLGHAGYRDPAPARAARRPWNLGRAVVEDYPAAVEAIREMGVSVGEQVSGIMTVGIGHSIGRPRACWITRSRTIERCRWAGRLRCLVFSASTHRRRWCCHRGGRAGGQNGQNTTITALQRRSWLPEVSRAAPDLVSTYMGPNADRMLVRSNKGSVGDGLRLGRAVDGATSRAMSTFYGHLVPSPLSSFTEEQYMPLAQYHSNHCILVNRNGRRFCDESQGDEVSVQELLAQPEARGVLLCDERIRTEYVVSEPFPNAGLIDRFEESATAGARLASADTLEELVSQVVGWDVDAVQLEATLEDYSAAARGETNSLDAPLPAEPEPLVEPPFWALEVQPAITFTYGGLRVDADGRVLDHDDAPVAGLWAAGVDAGGLSNWTYAGGLAPAFIIGRRAAVSALDALTPVSDAR